ncbi:MAG: hypothetical protein ABI560_02125 [Myxococcales bacterium]
MSDSHSKNAARGHQAEQSHTGKDMHLGTMIVVGAISLVLFAGGIVWAYSLMTSRQEEIRSGGLAATPSKLGQSEIGIVDQVLFETDHRLDDWKAENARRLSSYGWSDRSKGLAHMPIEAAMQQVIASPPDIAGQGVPPVTQIPATVKAGDVVAPAAGTPAPKTPKPGGAR